MSRSAVINGSQSTCTALTTQFVQVGPQEALVEGPAQRLRRGPACTQLRQPRIESRPRSESARAGAIWKIGAGLAIWRRTA